MTASKYRYSWPRHSPEMLRELDISCPVCGDEGGTWTVQLDSDRQVVGSPEFDCEGSSQCEAAYVNGQYGDALEKAIAIADRIESDGPSEIPTDGLSADDGLHLLREARAFK